MLTATVSGSFHRHMEAITRAVHELAALSVRVLSPADPRVVAAQGEFLFVASDRVRSVRLVQDRHLESIRVADFLWLVCPDGYVGQSAAMEIGYAAGAEVPIFGSRAPYDLTLRQYVTIVPSLDDAVRRAKSVPPRRRSEGILIDPHATIEAAHQTLEKIGRELELRSTENVEQALRVHVSLGDLQDSLTIPTLIQ
jgi:hypothetical protein